MHARVSTFSGPPEKLRESEEQFKTDFLPQALSLDGCRGVMSLIDVGTGKSLAITLWDSEDSLRASEERANQIRSDVADASRAQIVDVERYEVSIMEFQK